MKIGKSISLALAALFLFQSCDDGFGLFDTKTIRGKGEMERFEVPLNGFKGVDLEMSANVTVKQAAAYKVVVEAQKNIYDALELTVDGDGNLEIGTKSGVWNLQYDKLNILIETPSVSSLEVSSSGDLTVETPLTTDKLNMDVSGSGSIKIEQALQTSDLDIGLSGSGTVKTSNVTVGKISVSISGSGNAIVGGTAESADYSVSGSGGLNATKMSAKNVSAQCSGSGGIRCLATAAFNGSASGSGSIEFSGDAQKVATSASGSGSVNKVQF